MPSGVEEGTGVRDAVGQGVELAAEVSGGTGDVGVDLGVEQSRRGVQFGHAASHVVQPVAELLEFVLPLLGAVTLVGDVREQESVGRAEGARYAACRAVEPHDGGLMVGLRLLMGGLPPCLLLFQYGHLRVGAGVVVVRLTVGGLGRFPVGRSALDSRGMVVQELLIRRV